MVQRQVAGFKPSGLFLGPHLQLSQTDDQWQLSGAWAPAGMSKGALAPRNVVKCFVH